MRIRSALIAALGLLAGCAGPAVIVPAQDAAPVAALAEFGTSASKFYRGVRPRFYRVGSDPDALASDAVTVHDGEPGSDPTRQHRGQTPAALAGDAVNVHDGTGVRPHPATSGAFIFTYFTKNGEDGLHLAASKDGYHWDKLNGGRSYLTPKVGNAKLMRDPSIVRAPDGTFHMVWTSGWNENNIGYASSKDLVNWSAQKELPVMAHEPGVLNAWAPEVTYDARRAEFLIFWASTVPGKFMQTAGSSEEKYNHRIYATTTRDFVSFTPTALYYDPGFSVIDATFVHANERDYLLVKDETRHPPKKYLQLAASPDLQGPFGKLGAPITRPGLWVEGPTALQVGTDVIVYYDAYQSKHYGALRSRDLVTWEDVTDKMHFPDEGTPLRMRHGTAIAVPAALVDTLRTATETKTGATQ